MNRPSFSLCWSVVVLATCLLPIFSTAGEHNWTGSWYAAPVEFSPLFADATLRSVVNLTIGGTRLRLRFGNLYGRADLTIGAVYVATGGASKQVNFKGKAQLVLRPGAITVSDPIDLETVAGDQLTVSVFYPKTIPQDMTTHSGASVDTISPGNRARDLGQSEGPERPVMGECFLLGVDVDGLKSRGTIVALGDSITDGGADRWPALLAERLAREQRDYGVLNAGIVGNHLLKDTDNFGQSALTRFDRDVLGQPGVKYVILYEGINDLGHGETTRLDGSSPPALGEMIAAIRDLTERAHSHGVRIYVATLTPFEGTPYRGYYSVAKDELRQDVNKWIRTSGEIDGYFDFDRALSDPDQPNRMNPAFDSGDHLHPNGDGEQALSKAIDLSKFE